MGFRDYFFLAIHRLDVDAWHTRPMGSLRPNQDWTYHPSPNLSPLYAKRKGVKNKSPTKAPSKTRFIQIEDFYSDGWKLEEVVEILRSEGVGVIPTDTCYSFVTCLNSRKGVERLMSIKGGGKKPLSVICEDLSMIDTYTSSISRLKSVYKLLKSTLPGAFTYIMPSSSEVPKMIVDRKHHRLNKWRRKEIGVRMPDDSICRNILESLHEPLLSGSVPQAAEDEIGVEYISSQGHKDGGSLDEGRGECDDVDDIDEGKHDFFDTSYIELDFAENLSWAKEVDFVVLNGPRGGGSIDTLSTVVDLTQNEVPVLVRQGKGKLDPALIQGIST